MSKTYFRGPLASTQIILPVKPPMMPGIYCPSDEIANIATIHAGVYARAPAAKTGFHIPREQLAKTVRESER